MSAALAREVLGWQWERELMLGEWRRPVHVYRFPCFVCPSKQTVCARAHRPPHSAPRAQISAACSPLSRSISLIWKWIAGMSFIYTPQLMWDAFTGDFSRQIGRKLFVTSGEKLANRSAELGTWWNIGWFFPTVIFGKSFYTESVNSSEFPKLWFCSDILLLLCSINLLIFPGFKYQLCILFEIENRGV